MTETSPNLEQSSSVEDPRGQFFSTPKSDEKNPPSVDDDEDFLTAPVNEMAALKVYESKLSSGGLTGLLDPQDFGTQKKDVAKPPNRPDPKNSTQVRSGSLSDHVRSHLLNARSGSVDAKVVTPTRGPFVQFADLADMCKWAETECVKRETMEFLSSLASGRDQSPLVFSAGEFYRAMQCGESHTSIQKDLVNVIGSSQDLVDSMSRLIPTLETIATMKKACETMAEQVNSRAGCLSQLHLTLEVLQPFVHLTNKGKYKNIPLSALRNAIYVNEETVLNAYEVCTTTDEKSEILYDALMQVSADRKGAKKGPSASK